MPLVQGEGTGHLALAIEFPRVAQIDEHDAVLAVLGDGLIHGQGFDGGVGLGEELLVALFDLHPSVSCPAAAGY
jgi:hypothetical protein